MLQEVKRKSKEGIFSRIKRKNINGNEHLEVVALGVQREIFT